MQAPEATGRSPRRWVILALVWLLYASNGIAIAYLSPLAEPVRDDLGISYTQMGFVLGVWQLVSIVTFYPLGSALDRFSVRRFLGIGIVLVLLSVVLRGLAVDFYTLLFTVAIYGIGGPIISVGAPKVVSLWFTGRERNLATGIYASAPVVGMIVALTTANSVVVPLTGSWRGASVVYGAVVLVAGALWLAFGRDAPKRQPEAAAAALRERPGRSGLASLFRVRNVAVALVLSIVAFLVQHGLGNWAPTLLHEKGTSLQAAGFLMAAATAVGGVGVFLVLAAARPGRRALAVAILLSVGAATVLAMPSLSGGSLVTMIALANAVSMPMIPVLTLILMETEGVGQVRLGAAVGLLFAAAEIGGFLGPLLLGVGRDVTGSLGTGLYVFGALMAASVGATLLFRERRQRSGN